MTTITRTSPSLPSPTDPDTLTDLDATTELDASSPLGFEDAVSSTSYGTTDTFEGTSLARASSLLSSAASMSKTAPSLHDVRNGATMKLGMSGDSVRELQQKLNDAGTRPQLDVDGDFGPKTETALARFQTKNVDGSKAGVLDSATLAKLEASHVDDFPSLPESSPSPSANADASSSPVVFHGVPLSPRAALLGNAAEAQATQMHSIGKCAAGNHRALKAVGIEDGAGDAWERARQLANDPRFTEIRIDASELPSLPRGAVVVWGKGDDVKDGHVSVALGDGREASDHIQRQMTSKPGKGNSSDFGDGPTGNYFRVFLPSA